MKMEYENIVNLVDTSSDSVPKFINKKWIEVRDQSGESYSINKQIRFKKLMLRSDLCDYSNAYIVVKRTIDVTRPNNTDRYDKKLAFKSNASFISCISKIINTLIDNAEDLDIVTPVYNLMEYSKNYRKTTGSLLNYDRDEPSIITEGTINYSIKKLKSFDYKTSITGKLEGVNLEKKMLKLLCH